MSELEDLIHFLSYRSKIHINIQDVSRVLLTEGLRLNFDYKIHSKPYCDLAGSTKLGYKLCIRCKERANRKAITGKKPFWGLCPYGLFEIAYPVLLDNEVLCIIYIGHMMPTAEEYRNKLHKACRVTGVSPEALEALSADCEDDRDISRYLQMAELLSNVICRRCKENRNKKKPSHSDIVSGTEEYLMRNFTQDITLKQVARLYFMNEKYLGRLFLKETGKTFRQYLNDARLEHAVHLLKNTHLTVLQISLECGYSNVTYFNRVFQYKFSMTPSAYRNTL